MQVPVAVLHPLNCWNCGRRRAELIKFGIVAKCPHCGAPAQVLFKVEAPTLRSRFSNFTIDASNAPGVGGIKFGPGAYSQLDNVRIVGGEIGVESDRADVVIKDVLISENKRPLVGRDSKIRVERTPIERPRRKKKRKKRKK